jgi:acyl dehydratase
VTGAQRWLEDFAVGESFEGEPKTLDDASFAAFAQLTGDAHPIHYDDDYARKSRFGGRVAHGLLLASMTALGATPLSARLRDSMRALVSAGFKFVQPVLVGATVRPRFTVESVVVRPGATSGRLRLRVELLDAAGRPVARGFHEYALGRRPKE